MKGTPLRKRSAINVVKNFSTALAFPTAIVWDAKGVPQAEADAAWKTLLDALRADTTAVNDVTDGNVLIENWPRSPTGTPPSWPSRRSTYGEAERVDPNLAPTKWPSFLSRWKPALGHRRPGALSGPEPRLHRIAAHRRTDRAAGHLYHFAASGLSLARGGALPVIVATLGVVCTLGILCFLATPHSYLPFLPVMPSPFSCRTW
jgi:hypothetical protein